MDKYHIVSYHPFQNGFDDKSDCKILDDAIKECKRLLYIDNPNYEWYQKMFILNKDRIVLVFDEFHHNGRKPYGFEVTYLNS